MSSIDASPRARGEILRAWAPAVLYMTLIFVVSSFALSLPGPRVSNLDKVIHFCEYAVLGALCAYAAGRTWPDRALARTIGVGVVIATGFGISDELHQALVPGRSSEVLDVVADLLGSSAGASVTAVWRKRRAISSS